ncbi:MFS transporter [Paractinoplanes brasiliensis]|uniref:EmrB/QacA subfamily drug resistance transporter n=1 Tax=Paractinoplanes brasiliensis TaxID=52695 RepID=A0A4R6JQX2_9ACTN|nr:MFS transporter [Actinoplanes brasiliensis]TDO37286.1 EmrB/QacA subfamily drug resistance transporter [Actinoplanes brasiliensis]GID29400.1 MFS transporter [Actinoplanes brasiliensis]
MDPRTRRIPLNATYAVLAASVVVFTLMQSLLTPVLATMVTVLHTSQGTVTWVLTAYLLSASIFTPIMGRVGDILGKRGVLVLTLVALSVGSLLAATATTLTVMIIARVIQGVGGGALPLAFGIIRDEFPQKRVAGAVGLIASLSAVGGGLGIVLAGPVVDHLGFRWLFWLPMIATIATAAAAHFWVPPSPARSGGTVSWLPAVPLSAWLVCLLLAMNQATVRGWASPAVIGLLIGALALGAAWIAAEQRAATPLIDLRMLRLKAVWTGNLVALLTGAAMYAVFAFLPQFVQTPSSAGYGFGAGIAESGLLLLPSSITMFASGALAGRLASIIGAKRVVVLGCLIAAASMALLAVAHGHTWEIYLSSALIGVGLGLVFAAMSGLVVAAVPPSQTGVASGMNANIRTIGGSIGAALMASVVTSQLMPSGLPEKSGYTLGFAAMAVVLVLAAVAALLPEAPATPRMAPAAPPAEQGELATRAGGAGAPGEEFSCAETRPGTRS